MNKGQHILIVDDDEGVRDSLSLILKKRGYEVETAGTGYEALDKAHEHPFNLTLLDIRLPDIAGTELLSTLKKTYPPMMVIMVTAHASMETAVRALNEGAYAYVTKPLNIEYVLATIKQALEKQYLTLEMESLYRAIRAIGEATSLDDIVRAAAEGAATLGLFYCSLVLVSATDARGAPTRCDAFSGYVQGDTWNAKPPIVDISVPDSPIVHRLLHEPDFVLVYADIHDPPGPIPDHIHVMLQAVDVRGLVITGLNPRGRPIGFLNFGSADSLRDMPDQHLRRIRAYADQVATAVENRLLLDSLEQEKEHMDLLYRLSQRLAESLDVHDVAQWALDEICHVLGALRGVVMVRAPQDDRLRLVAVSGYDAESVEILDRRINLRVGKGLLGWAAAHQRPTLVSNVMQDERWITIAGLDDWVYSALSVPLISGEELVGGMSIYSDQVGFFTVEHLRLAESAAAAVAAAIVNARLFEAERQQRQEAETLRKAALALATTLDREEVIERILAQLQQVVPYDSASVQLLEGDQTRIVGGRGFPNLEEIIGLSFPLGEESPNDQVIRTRRPFIVENAMADYAEFRREPHAQAGICSWLGVPMQVGEHLVGMITLDKQESRFYTQKHARLAEAFAAQAAIAIENAQLYRQLQTHAVQLEERVQRRTAQLQAQNARLEAILSSTTDGIIVADARGEILQTNPIAQSWLTHILRPQDGQQFYDAVQELALRAAEQPVTILELSGFDLELVAAPIGYLDGEDAAAAVVIVVHDVTHLKALDRMKNRFVSDVSHELRNPITTIKLYATLIQQAPMEKRGEYLDALIQEVDRQARLVENILQISRIDGRRMELATRRLDLNELTENAVLGHQILAHDKQLSLEHHPANPGPIVQVDPERMMQVLNNLVENSLHYTPAGGRVVVSTGSDYLDDRTWAVATVVDTGLGIPPQELSHIFERFFRGSHPRKLKISGTGLGLAIAREIVELHGGRITVTSEVNHGSTFTVWLPLSHTS
ncbi:MAG TPA: response regulator [Chloroflexi bacterium]|nr:response regulator [Chloroflexota bacterium]